jgi:hypothetical protein
MTRVKRESLSIFGESDGQSKSVATPEEARKYAELLIDPRVQTRHTPDDQTPENNLQFLERTFEMIPAAILEVLVQAEQAIVLVRPGESISDYTDNYDNYLKRNGKEDDDERKAYVAKTAGLFISGISGPGRFYIQDHDPGVLSHEIGHSIDAILGHIVESEGGYSVEALSDEDDLLLDAFANGTELLNAYSAEDVGEAFAEWFRSALGVGYSVYDSPGVDVRADAIKRAPTLTTYMDNLAAAIEVALAIDPQAFGEEPEIDTDLYVSVRASVATMTFADVRSIDMNELMLMRDAFLALEEIDSQRPQTQARSSALVDIDPPSAQIKEVQTDRVYAAANARGPSDDFGLDL